jgi:hypothetical protein
MKRIIVIIATLAFAAALGFAGCKKQEAPQPAVQSTVTSTVTPTAPEAAPAAPEKK